MSDIIDPQVLLATLIYSAVGAVVFGLAFGAVVKLAPFSVRKEIEEDQNVALAVVIGSVVVGLAIIIAAVMVSG